MALHHRKPTPPPKRRVAMNHNITSKSVLLIDETGARIGEVNTREALEMAQTKELDLIVINEKSSPPIAKIMDYGRHLYEQKRKTRDSKKKASFVKVKSVNVKPQINDHDLQWKSTQAITWLQNGDRVQFVIKAYGRIGTKIELIQATYQKFVKLLENYGTPQGPLKKNSPVQYEVFFVPAKSTPNPVKEKNNNE